MSKVRKRVYDKSYHEQYHRDHAEEVNLRHRQWRRDHPEKERQNNARRYKDRRAQWEMFLQVDQLKCSICGYDNCYKALDWHHIDPANKKYNISSFMGSRAFNEKNKKIFIKELCNCICLCANCHREFHANDMRAEVANCKIRLSRKPKIKTTQVQLKLELDIE